MESAGSSRETFQCEGKNYDDKSDMWALGCVLYEMAALQKAFEADNLPALVNKIMKVCRWPDARTVSEDCVERLKQESRCSVNMSRFEVPTAVA